MKKKLLISAGIIIVVAGLTLGALYYIKQVQPVPDTTTKTTTSKTLVLDHSKDYGACTALDTTVIKSTLGDTASNLQAAQNMGITKDKYRGDGVQNITSDSQTCIYAFVPGGNASNGFNATNAFSIQKTVFTNKGGPATLIAQIQQNADLATPVTSVGDSAFFSSDTTAQGPSAVYSFSLEVFTGTKATTYMITQPATAATFNAGSAQTTLLQLAKLAS